MSFPCRTARVPRARIDPIDDDRTALALLRLLRERPPEPETIVVLLDDARRGISAIKVAGTPRPDDLLGVLDALLTALADDDGEVSALIVASVRPGGGVGRDDADRWLEASDLCADHGLELREWFVLGRRAVCPRDLLGERPRWCA